MTASTAGGLAQSLLDLVERQLTALAGGPLPGFHLPGLLLGHPVGPDVRADLLFTLGLAHAGGRTTVAGRSVDEALTAILAGVSGRRTHSFYSYRVAETVGRFGPFDGNPLLAGLGEDQRHEVAVAADSTDWIAALDDGLLPRNYAAVLARCEHARLALGLTEDTSCYDALLARVHPLVGGTFDDSNTGIGRYDIYSVDIHLFCEPLAGALGERWRQGVRTVLDLVDRVAGRDGAALAWGRSTGILALCHTIELAGLVARHDVDVAPDRWVARAAGAAGHLDGWFEGGFVTAHQHRSSDLYGGLDRRLQLTLDCLGKLADAARGLLLVADLEVDQDEAGLFPERDEVVWFDRRRHAGVWSFRSPATAFTLPLVGATTTDYVPAPRNPGLHEVPVGSALVTGTPLILHRGVRYAGAGLPKAAEHRPGQLHARYEGFPEAGRLEGGSEARTFAGTRDVTWRVEGRTLWVEEQLDFEVAPHALAVQVAEPAERPLLVRFDGDGSHTVSSVDVDGIAEYRSCWSELRRLHQVDVEPTTSVRLAWSVTPVLRVVSTAAGHHYNDSLYAPMGERVRVERLPFSTATDLAALARMAARTDQFHLHWPEWLPLGGLDAHRRLIDGLRGGGVRIVWTQHNLVAHSKDPAMEPVYQAWAEAADLVVHHSRWGRERARATYDYGVGTRHAVVAHGHFGGPDVPSADPAARASVERELGLKHGALRIGVVGAPRVEKDLGLAMRAVARCARPDLELIVLSLGDEAVPEDPRIVARRYELVSRQEYDRRLLAMDALLMPFEPDGDMLATGTVGDALGFGLPTVASSWPFLTETLGPAAITYGRTEDDLVNCLEGLDRAALAAAAEAARARRHHHAWPAVAELTWAELDRLGSTHH